MPKDRLGALRAVSNQPHISLFIQFLSFSSSGFQDQWQYLNTDNLIFGRRGRQTQNMGYQTLVDDLEAMKLDLEAV